MSSALNESDLLTYARWLDILGRESITRKFFRALEETVALMAGSLAGSMGGAERRELALIYLSRLIFLSFLETKGWLDSDFGFLENGFGRCMEQGGHYHRRILEPLFFGTLNTPVTSRAARAKQFGRVPFLNGGLFARSSLEKRARRFVFADEAFGTAFGSLLSRYRFSAREESTAWSEAAIDPEMLGKALEALMAADTRKGSGAFYTPQELVEHVTDEALEAAVADDLSLRSLCQLRVLDPACGSGAFLVYILERLGAMRIERGESGSVAEIRRRVLASSIFGVDLNPTAVWLCELRLWLSVVVETDEGDPMRVVPLPNLDRHIRVGDSLAAGDLVTVAVSGRKLQSLRARYMRATGPRKLTLARALDRHERDAAVQALARRVTKLRTERKEILLAQRARDLFGNRHSPTAAQRTLLLDIRRRLNAARSRARVLEAGGALPFSFEAHFADAAAAGGFDIVVGNPPWVRLHRIPIANRQSMRREFTVYREAAWQKGATMAGAGRGFSAQVDMAALFVERSHGLLRNRGTMALLLPAKLWRSLAGGGVRALLSQRSELLLLEDHGDARSGFDAAVYPSLMVCRTLRPSAASKNDAVKLSNLMRCEVRTRGRVARWKSSSAALPFDGSHGSPWLLAPPEVRRAFDCVREAGIPLSDSPFGRPLLGVKTGYNKAYVVSLESVDEGIATIATNERRSTIEVEILRPAVRGESLVGSAENREHVVWPHDLQGRPLQSLPPLTSRWLAHYRRELSLRTDLHSHSEWWSVFRVESASNTCPRVIWADIGRRPHAIVANAGSDLVPLNTCYVVPCPSQEDALALAALINGPLIAAWLDLIAEPARGDYRRYLGWTMSFLPIPSDWPGVRATLAGATSNDTLRSSDACLLEAGLKAYGIERRVIEPLLEWTRRSP
jgi:methylase of polypeptide subunit release factors